MGLLASSLPLEAACEALWLANETECLAKQYICAMSAGSVPKVLPDKEMDVMLAKFKTYGKQDLHAPC